MPDPSEAQVDSLKAFENQPVKEFIPRARPIYSDEPAKRLVIEDADESVRESVPASVGFIHLRIDIMQRITCPCI